MPTPDKPDKPDAKPDSPSSESSANAANADAAANASNAAAAAAKDAAAAAKDAAAAAKDADAATASPAASPHSGSLSRRARTRAARAVAFARAPGFLEGGGDRESVVLSTRIRLARNLATQPFPGRATPVQKNAVFETCAAALASVAWIPRLRGGEIHEISKLASEERTLLVESHLISKELAGSSGSAVFLSRDQTCSVMINEEDHLRIQIVRGGLQFEKAWKGAREVDEMLGKRLDLAFSPRLGYLTACPTNLGTGMRASAMLHLPGLVIAGQMDKICRSLGNVGITVRGWCGEGSDASGSIFQISNQHTLGYPEEDILKHLKNWLHRVIHEEKNARLSLLESDDLRLFDQIARAFGVLQNALLLTTAEAMGALSLMRLSADLGLHPPHLRQVVDKLLIETQPAHIQNIYGARNARARDSFRALHVLREFRTAPPPSFSRYITDDDDN